MRFTNTGPAITEQDIESTEASLGLTLPSNLRAAYLQHNGGRPKPYVYEDDNVDTVVSAFLPLKSTTDETSVDVYRDLVLSRELVPAELFPFAADGGGDYFFVDCSPDTGDVYFYASDTAAGGELVSLGMDVEAFWSYLKEE